MIFPLCEFSNLFLLPRGVSICLVPVLMRRGRAWSVVTHVVTPDPGTPGQSVMVTSITRCLRCYQDAADFHEVGFLTIQNKKVDTSSKRLSIVYIYNGRNVSVCKVVFIHDGVMWCVMYTLWWVTRGASWPVLSSLSAANGHCSDSGACPHIAGSDFANAKLLSIILLLLRTGSGRQAAGLCPCGIW